MQSEPTEIRTKGDLLTLSGGSPVLRGEVPAKPVGHALWLADGETWATAYLRPTHTHGLNVMLHAGDADQAMTPGAVALLAELARSAAFVDWLGDARAEGADGLSIPRASVPVLGHLLADPEHAVGRWEWMDCATVPPVAPEVALVELDPSSRGELERAFAEHNPRTDGQPFARPGQRWVGVRDDDGALLALGCCETEWSGAPVLAGILTLPAARGRGLGRAVTAELTRGAIAEHGWCTLGMYSDNDIARRLYLDLGYRIGAEWTSGPLR